MLLLVLLFIVVPLVELYVIIKVGELIGALPTIALLLLDSFLGAALLRSQGRAVWRRFNLALAEGRVPAAETFDGAMVIFGGALLITPGFITDAVGLILLLPPTRALIRRALAGWIRRRLAMGERVVMWTYGRPRHGRPRPGGAGERYDIDGAAREVPEEPFPEEPPGRRTLPP